MSEPKPCKVCNFTRQKSYGLVVPSLDELKTKGSESLGFSPSTAVSVVLEDDGTIVEDEAYFLCLPTNTKFMLLHEKEMWAPSRRIDGGTAWMNRESMDLDAVDGGLEPWQYLAQQLHQDLASIVLMSEADLQTLVDTPCPQLASALGFQEARVQSLQDTLQRVLDHREEERQSRELLRLYLRAVEREDSQLTGASQDAALDVDGTEAGDADGTVAGDVGGAGAGDVDVPDGVEVDSTSGFMRRTLMVLKGKTSPETRLSTEELQMVVTKGAGAMEQVLGWDSRRTSALLLACEGELSSRLEQVQAMRSLTSTSTATSSSAQQGTTQPSEDSQGQDTPAKRSK